MSTVSREKAVFLYSSAIQDWISGILICSRFLLEFETSSEDIILTRKGMLCERAFEGVYIDYTNECNMIIYVETVI